MPTQENPTEQIDLSFSNYANVREEAAAAHMVDGVSDYCFSLDKQMRSRLSVLKPLQALAKAALGVAVTIQRELMQLQGVAVGPNQYPEIHAIGEDCARRLGIGVPQIFVKFDVQPNAYTFATDECGEMIVLHTSLVEMMTYDELRFIIGHESGHIHNKHTVYNTMVQLISNSAVMAMLYKFPISYILLPLIRSTLGYLLMAWSRCAEITADRAGLICCGDVNAARYALAKLQVGGGEKLHNINLEQYVHQIENVQATPVRFTELDWDHPVTSKRIEALRLFSRCEPLFGWRPEMRGDGPVSTREEVDSRCEEFISVLSKGYQGFWR